jgi:hypothetical protein
MRGAERDKFFASDERRPDLFVRPGEETQQIPARWRRDFTPAHFHPDCAGRKCGQLFG